MKTKISYSLLAAAMACGTAHGQTTAYTTPVGYTTTTVFGAFAPGSRKISTIAPNLVNSSTFTGKVASKTGDVIVLTGAAFVASAYNPIAPLSLGAGGPGTGTNPLLYSYYLEAEAGGYWSHVAANGTDSVTVEVGDGANFAVGETVTLRQHVTLLQYLGSNSPGNGFAEAPGGDTTSADVFTIIDEANASTNSFFYSPGILGGSEKLVSFAFDKADSWPVYPEQGLQVSRAIVGNLPLVYSSTVNTNQTQLPIKTGLNLRPIVLPVDTTLAQLNLWTGSNVTGIDGTDDLNPLNADNIVILVDGNPTTVFYQTVDLGFGFTGFYSTSFDNYNNVVLPAGASIQIIRNNPDNSAPFEWSVPAPVVGP